MSSAGRTVTPIATATGTPGMPIQVGVADVFRTAGGDRHHAGREDGLRRQRGLGTVTPVTMATNTAGTPIRVGRAPGPIAITPDGKTAYVANGADDPGGGTVTPITTATNTPGKPIRVGSGPVCDRGHTGREDHLRHQLCRRHGNADHHRDQHAREADQGRERAVCARDRALTTRGAATMSRCRALFAGHAGPGAVANAASLVSSSSPRSRIVNPEPLGGASHIGSVRKLSHRVITDRLTGSGAREVGKIMKGVAATAVPAVALAIAVPACDAGQTDTPRPGGHRCCQAASLIGLPEYGDSASGRPSTSSASPAGDADLDRHQHGGQGDQGPQGSEGIVVTPDGKTVYVVN